MNDPAPNRPRYAAKLNTNAHGRALATSIHAGDKMQFLSAVAPNRRLNATDLRCCIAIVSLFNSRWGRSWPSYAHLCEATGCSRAGVAKSIQKLDELGLIVKERGGKGRSNTYRPAFALVRSQGDAQREQREQRERGVSPTGPEQSSGLDADGQRGETQYYTYPSEDTEKDRCRGGAASGGAPLGSAPAAAARSFDGDAPGFDAFFAAYPKREGRAAALRAYEEALRAGDLSPEVLLDGAKKYAAAKQHTQPRYIKMPANWLRDRCWLEDPQPPKLKANKTTTAKAKPAEHQHQPQRGGDAARPAPDLELEEIRRLDAQSPAPSLGKAKSSGYFGFPPDYWEILSPPNSRAFVIVRRIMPSGQRDIFRAPASNFKRTLLDVIRDRMDGVISDELADAEYCGLTALKGWSRGEASRQYGDACVKLAELEAGVRDIRGAG